jgi:hypothetical protein
MAGGYKQRVLIKFCFKISLSATETQLLVQKAYGNEAVNRSNHFLGVIHDLKDGREKVEDDERGGRPKSTPR